MIDIYLNPINDMIYSSVETSDYQTSPDNIRAAQDLIRELNNRGVDTSIIECNALIHTKNKGSLELAAKKLQDILNKNKEYVPALVNMALCKFLQKKSTDARNYLKTCLKNEFQL
jgi:tetratricopeptide repeat protein 21B